MVDSRRLVDSGKPTGMTVIYAGLDLEQAVADGAALIKQQGDAGLDKTTPFGWETGRHVVHNSYIWITAIEHSTEHFGQLVVYYRANNLVPPESRR